MKAKAILPLLPALAPAALLAVQLATLLASLLAAGCGGKPPDDHLASVRIEQILVRPKPTPEALEQAAGQAGQLLRQLRDGADFAELARTHSTHASAAQGGELVVAEGWLPKPLEDTLFALPDSGLSGVIRTPDAAYIMQRLSGEYLQVRTSHILVKPVEEVKGEPSEQSQENAHRKALQLYERLQQGESFYDLARENSDDEGTAGNGGDVGWTKRNGLDRDYEAVVFNQEPGQISRPFKTRFGWHIARTVQKRNLSLKVRLIELKAPIGPQENRKAVEALRQARELVRRGSPFPAVAESLADNPDGVFKYNEPYEVRRNMLIPSLAQELSKLDEGDVSGIIETDDGAYFVRLLKKG